MLLESNMVDEGRGWPYLPSAVNSNLCCILDRCSTSSVLFGCEDSPPSIRSTANSIAHAGGNDSHSSAFEDEDVENSASVS